MNKHYTFQEYLEKFTSIQDSYDYYFELQKEIDRLENIIQEVRERLIKPSKFIERAERLKLLEILDKEKV